MSNFLRRLPLSRLLALCATVVAIGALAAALASALGTGPTPPPKPLADAVHDALEQGHTNPVAGVSARIELTDRLIEGSSLANQAGSSASNPLLTGASGRLWISADGRVRVELQSERGDTEIFYDGRTVSLYDGSSNMLYRYTLQESGEGASGWASDATNRRSNDGGHSIPTVAEIQEAIGKVMERANLSGAIPTDVAGQAAYAVRISPSHDGGLVGGAELAWDAAHGVPLKLAVYSTQSPSPVLELAATEVSYEAIPESVFAFTPPPGAKVTEVKPGTTDTGSKGSKRSAEPRVTHERGLAAVQAAVPFTIDAPPTLAGMDRDEVRGAQVNGHAAALVTYGRGLGGIAVLQSAAKGGADAEEEALPSSLGELPKVALPGASATELPTPLGTLMSFRRAGVAYLLAGSVTAATLQEAAKGL